MIPAQLTTSEYAAIVGRNPSTVRRQIARNEFPPGSVIRIGRSKHAKHARLLTAKLIAAGWLLPQGAAS